MTWASERNTVLTVAAASVAPILYLIFVGRDATNVMFGDDWSVVPLVHAAAHGNLTLSLLWGQYNESRLFLGNLVDVLFGVTDHLDLRAVIFFSAALFIASYAILLELFRQYLGKRLTPLPVFVIGLVWFSLADVQNALWAFQVSWYLTTFFFIVMLFALLAPDRRSALWLAIAVIAAIAGSLSTLQGFFLWPLGAICLLWSGPRSRRAVAETAAWFGAMIVILALYVPGYNVDNNGCVRVAVCTPSFSLQHPLTALRFFLALIGNVVPGGGVLLGDVTNPLPYGSVGRFEVVGAILFVVAVFILVQSVRTHASGTRAPLPFLLIGYSLAVDVTITLGRTVSGPAGAVGSNRYVMTNLILVTGIVMYGWAHIRPGPSAHGHWLRYATALGTVFLAIFLVIQVVAATEFGLTNGKSIHRFFTRDARLIVNLDRMPPQAAGCGLHDDLGAGPSVARELHDAMEDHLGELRPNTYRYYRQLGPPPVDTQCAMTPGSR